MAKSPKEVLAEFQENLPKLQQAIPEVTADFTKRLMPDALKDRVYYHPSDQGFERDIKARIKEWWKGKK